VIAVPGLAGTDFAAGHVTDAVVAIEVIEHLENTRAVTRGLFEMLKPGAVLVMTTPNVESWRSILSLIVRGHFVDFLDSSYPAHITAMVSMDLNRVLHESGFAGIQPRYSGRGVLPFWTRLSWQALSLGWLKGKRSSDHVLFIARKDS
jgi:hypothetical protein